MFMECGFDIIIEKCIDLEELENIFTEQFSNNCIFVFFRAVEAMDSFFSFVFF